MEIIRYVKNILAGNNLEAEESARAMQIMVLGGANPAQISSYLTALRMKGETSEEIAGAISFLRSKMPKVEYPEDTVFIHANSQNAEEVIVSSLILATLNVPVYVRFDKSHGLHIGQALGINMNLTLDTCAKCLDETKVCLTFPQKKNPLRNLIPIQQELEFPTILDMVSPLASPVNPYVHISDIANDIDLELLASALKDSGCENGMLINSGSAYQVNKDKVSKIQHQFAFEETAKISLNANEKAGRIRATLTGQDTTTLDAAILRTAYVLALTNTAKDIEDGKKLATDVIKSRVAFQVLDKLVEVSNEQVLEEEEIQNL